MGKYRRVHRGRFIPVLIVLICLLGLTFWGALSTLAWAKNNVLLHLLEIQSLTHDEIRETITVEGLLVKHEEPVKAPADGLLTLLVEDGDRLQMGTLLAEISGLEDKQVWSPGTGIFCTHLDNLENLLVPGMIDVLDMDAVEKINNSVRPASGEVVGGQIIGKMVDNLQPVLVFIQLKTLDEYTARSFKKDTDVTLNWNERKLSGKIAQVSVMDRTVSMFVELLQYPEVFLHERRVQLDLVTRQMTGWLVPEEAIVFKEGKPGLYIVSEQTICWVPVTVQDRLQGRAAVSSNILSSSVRFIKNPSWAREGVRLN
ncbi:HlyD family secretion protein [Sporotomaculum syntrophicum]|uniref:HlyD family secretion protein n=1 Tax=Sporotomaculum syntrophicum TaxID=182264 RepID=A0A9D2WPM4_9FIRM|nr:HlyD family efflux transporter periplasmic adaptor subunit [Sporotomaculum syntrophicum]KAF1084815.1 HlyD family secretion protein [Sporotomaculum syntrophicum]